MSTKSPKSTKTIPTQAPKAKPAATRLVSTQLALTFSIGREARLFREQCPSLRVGPRPIVWNVSVLETIVMDMLRNLALKVRASGDNRLQPEHIRHFVEQSPLLRRMLGQDAQFMWSAMTNYIHPEVMHSKTRKNNKKAGAESDPLQVMSKKDLIKQVKAQQRVLNKAKAKKAPAAAKAAPAEAPAASKKTKTTAAVASKKGKSTAAPVAAAAPSVKKTKKTAAAVVAEVAAAPSVKKSKKTAAATPAPAAAPSAKKTAASKKAAVAAPASATSTPAASVKKTGTKKAAAVPAPSASTTVKKTTKKQAAVAAQ